MSLTTLTALFRHNTWANERMLDAASHLAQVDFVRDLKTSHGCIRDTLTHILWAEAIWLERWRGGAPTLVLTPGDFPNVHSLREGFGRVDRERAPFLNALTNDALLQVVEYRNLRGEPWRYPLWQQLHHVLNHSAHHRGQVGAMLRQLGTTCPPTDVLVYYDEGGR